MVGVFLREFCSWVGFSLTLVELGGLVVLVTYTCIRWQDRSSGGGKISFVGRNLIDFWLGVW